MSKVIKIGVSACLVGHRVRYDGKDQQSALIDRELASRFELIPICPEVGAGMQVPRPPIQIMRGGAGFKLCQVDDHAHDVTEQLRCYAQGVIDEYRGELCGFVLKSRSPSCGIDDTPWFDETGVLQLSAGAGLFAGMLMKRYPLLPLLDESRVKQPQQRRDFIRRVREYACGNED